MAVVRSRRSRAIARLTARAFTVPTDRPESDGTLEWNSTTIVVAEVEADEVHGLGYSYASSAAALLIHDVLAPLVVGRDGLDVPSAWLDMRRAVRNLGRPGVASHAIAAVDTALWDLKAKRLGLPLVSLLGAVREAVPLYGSGGFTSYSDDELQAQLAGWASSGLRAVKMKVGRQPDRDGQRVRLAREAIGPATELFVDANGAYDRKDALIQAERFAEQGVRWFEEPVSSDDLEGLRLLRNRGPAGMAIAAGEYGCDLPYFRRMLDAGAVDVLQADATRCAGVSGFLQAGALCEAYGVPLSAHTAPALHAAPCCSVASVRHAEYFHDHVRIEQMLFDGVPAVRHGCLEPDRSRPGLGLTFKRADAERYAVR